MVNTRKTAGSITKMSDEEQKLEALYNQSSLKKLRSEPQTCRCCTSRNQMDEADQSINAMLSKISDRTPNLNAIKKKVVTGINLTAAMIQFLVMVI